MRTGFESVKIGSKYVYRGQELSTVPASLKTYGDVIIEYEVLPGWKEDISKIKSFEELPENCKNFVIRLEELIGVPINYIGELTVFSVY